MNTVQLVGRLTKDVELKYTSSNVAVGNFTLAVNRNFRNQDGEREADFILCQIWRKSAENLANYARKGSQIGIEGRIQTRNYENQQGQRVYITEVIVEQFHLLEPKQDSAQQQVPTSGYQQPQQQQFQQQPQQQQNYNNNQNYGSFNMQDGKPVDISEDQLPF